MNKLKNTLLAIVFVLPVLFVATSCDDDDEGKDGWTDAQLEALTEECVSEEEGTQEQCECLTDKISDEWTYEEYNNLTLDDLGRAIEIALDCVGSI
ncbi:MAG: hypothetical protein ABJO02_20460 [Reichenbachiella sp.]|uniref:hypothetical protein n=1 Tax=Reichenbachiella sp. TaxID=2184521 RepID=UPI002966B291|nr:hypothetical protein [Reichenbachiella sp.]MDW3211044.1 hypothetical protein [Reichenbachiella sp.]